jgi:hypothetical protein
MPVGCYNLWEDPNPNVALTFVRTYLEIDDLGLGCRLEDFLKDPGYMKDYKEWETKNLSELEKIRELKEVNLDSLSIGDSTLNKTGLKETEILFIKGRNFWKRNLTIKTVREKIPVSIELRIKEIEIHKQLIPLYKMNFARYSDSLKNTGEEISKLKIEIIALRKLDEFLKDKPKRERIKTLICE